MKHTVPFATIVEPEPEAASVPERFLPGDGLVTSARFAAGPVAPLGAAPRVPVEHPPVMAPSPDLRLAAREAEATLERRRAEEAAEERRRQEHEEFRRDAAALDREVADSLERVREIETELADEEDRSRRAGVLLVRGVDAVRSRLERAERIQPEHWTAPRMREELPAAEARLKTIEREAHAETTALRAALPGRNGGVASVWHAEWAHRLRSAVAFLLPLAGAAALIGVMVKWALERI